MPIKRFGARKAVAKKPAPVEAVEAVEPDAAEEAIAEANKSRPKPFEAPPLGERALKRLSVDWGDQGHSYEGYSVGDECTAILAVRTERGQFAFIEQPGQTKVINLGRARSYTMVEAEPEVGPA